MNPTIATAKSAISRVRRDLTIGLLLKFLLLGVAVSVILFEPMVQGGFGGTFILIGIGVLWFLLSARSARGTQLAVGASPLIAMGQFDAAEQQLDEALRSFSLFRGAKLIGLHHLAVLRHAQRRFTESAALSRALLGQRLGTLERLSKPTRLILAESLLETSDPAGAYDALVGLYRHRLSLAEATTLLSIQTDYSTRIGAWDAIVQGIDAKLQMCELMPSERAARTLGFLALALMKVGRTSEADVVRRRAALLVDPADLITQRPLLSQVWVTANERSGPEAL